MPRAFLWSLPTSRILPAPTITKPMTRCCASPKAADRRIRPPPAQRRAPLQEPRRNGARCSPICRRRSPRPSRSPSVARSARTPQARSCRAFRSATAWSTRRAKRRSRRLRRRAAAPACGAAPASRPAHGDRGRLPRAARIRARRHRRMKYRRLLPDRRRFHPMGEGAGHSGRAGPRFRRRFAGRLCADHHRPRSDPLRAAVRALPQSRTRVDAGLRHRFLPGPARRGDPLRAGALRPRPRGADHHLRHACRRAACCATSAACCRCPTARSTGSASWCRRTRPTRSR